MESSITPRSNNNSTAHITAGAEEDLVTIMNKSPVHEQERTTAATKKSEVLCLEESSSTSKDEKVLDSSSKNEHCQINIEQGESSQKVRKRDKSA